MRNKADTTHSGAINIGSASVVMVFAVLALTIFAVLTLVTARSESTLAEKTAQAVRAYYDADSEAAGIVNVFLAEGTLPDDAESYAFSVPVDEAQELCVTLEDTGDGIVVSEWIVISSADWAPDESLDVYIPD